MSKALSLYLETNNLIVAKIKIYSSNRKMKKTILIYLSIIFFSTVTHSQNISNPFCINSPLFENIELGFGSFRYHVNWFKFDSAGVYDFAATDYVSNIYGATDIEPIIIFKCTPPIPDTSALADTSGWLSCEKELWEKLHDASYPSAETSWYPSDTTAWKNFLKAFVERYNGNGIDDYHNLVYPFRVYQLEVEMTRVWCTNTADIFPDDYVRYINLSYRTIKETDPNAIVKMAGWGSIDVHMFYYGFIDTDSIPISENLYVNSYHLDTSQIYQNNLANWLYIYNNADYDILDVHCYGLAEHMPGRAVGLKTLFDPQDTKPLWALEGGGPYRYKAEIFNLENSTGYLSSELVEENAAYVVRYYIGGIASGFTRLAWNVIPEYDPWGQAFGDLNLLSINYEKKPSYWAYKGLASLISDYNYAVNIPNGMYWDNPEIIGYMVSTPSKDYTFIWNLKDSTTIQLQGITKQLIFPVIMGDSIWTEVPYNSDSIYTFITSRIPLIFEGQPNQNDIPSNTNAIEQVVLYPNPSSGKLFINSLAKTDLIIEIFNIMGNLVYSIILNEGSNQIDFSEISNGVYIVKIGDKDKTIDYKKLIISK
jgi:hypothetical protein